MRFNKILFIINLIYYYNFVMGQNEFQNFSYVNNSIDFRSSPTEIVMIPCMECIRIFIDYMIMKYLNQVVIFSCGINYDDRNAHLLLSKAGISAVFAKETSIDIKKLKRLFPEREPKGIFLNYDCLNSTKMFSLASKLSLFDDVHLWTIFTSNPADTIVTLKRTNLNINSNILMIVNQDEDQWIAYDVYNIGYSKGAPLNVTFYGIYSKRSHLANTAIQRTTGTKYPKPMLVKSNGNYTKDDIESTFQQLQQECFNFWDNNLIFASNWYVFLKEPWLARRWSMNKEITLIGAYCAVDKPLKGLIKTYLYSRENVHRDTYTRVFLEMMDSIQDMLQFKLKLVRTNTWGAYINGSWTGVLGALDRGDADISLSASALKSERVKIADVAGYVTMARFMALFRQPQSSRASAALFVHPLDSHAWAVAVPIAILTVLLAMIIMFIEIKLLGRNSGKEDISFGNALIYLVCVLYQDGPERYSRLWSGKTLIFFSLMYGYLVSQFYSASLIGSILMEPPKQISNVKDLIHSDLEYRVEEVVYQRMFFQEYMRFDDVRELYEKKLMKPGKVPSYINAELGLNMTKQGGFAFQTNAAYAYSEMRYWGDDIICEVDELLIYPLTRLYNRMRRHSPYRQHISKSMLLMYERGIQAYINDRWFYKKPRCPPDHATRPRPVGEQFYPALELLGFIGVLSLLILFMEMGAAIIHEKYFKTFPYIK